MKRYLLFAGDFYYPRGGWSDHRGDFETIEDAVEAAAASRIDWYQVVDFTTCDIVKEGHSS